jgi:transcriptional regulator GlxA family with amidase domain
LVVGAYTLLAFKRSTYHSSKINYIPSARFVRAGRIWTASGVSAGIDMGFSIASDFFDAGAIENDSNHPVTL